MNSNPAVTESLEHDPLCPCNPNQQECGCGEDPEWGPCVSCKCVLIAKVREDERVIAIRDAVSAVHAALAHHIVRGDCSINAQRAALSAIKGDQP